MLGCGNRKKRHDTAVHTDAPKTTECSAKDEDVHSVRGTTNGRSNFEQEDVDEIQDLSVELSIHFPLVVN